MIRFARVVTAALVVLAAPLSAQVAQQSSPSAREILTTETFVRPPAAVEAAVTAPRHLNVSLSNPSPDRKHFVKVQSEGLPPIAAFGKPHYYLGGLQVDFRANRVRSLTTRSGSGLELIDATTGRSTTIETPRGGNVTEPTWSPDGSQIAYLAHFDDATHVYVADAATGRSRQVTRTPVLATRVTDLDWTADGRQIVTILLPDGRGAEPRKPAVETGPLVRLNDGDRRRTRTYMSLLRDQHEQQLLEYYTTGQLALVDVRSRAVRKIGPPAMISSANVSPDGRYVRVSVMQKPFSYIVPVSMFGQVDELWDLNGRVVAELSSRPLREGDGRGGGFGGAAAGTDTAARGFGWLPTGSGMYYLQQEAAARAGSGAAPRGPGNAQQRRKDRLYHWLPPYDAGGATVVLESDNRIAGVLYTEDAKGVFAAENVSGTGHLYYVSLDEPARRHTIYRMRGVTASAGRGFGGFTGGRGGGAADSAAFFQNPGALLSKRGAAGVEVALVSSDGKHAYLEGTRYFPNWQQDSPRGFVDKVEIATGQKARIFEGSTDAFETVVAALDDDFTQAIVQRETRTDVPDSYLRDLRAGTTRKLTSNRDYTPEITNAQRSRVQVTRADGYKFFVNVTLPQDYRPGTRLPAMFWFYPREYTSQEGYDRSKRTENINRFPQIGPRSAEIWVTHGYALVQPDAPIVGEDGRMNDNYVHDLRNNLAAVIDELDRRGIVDRQRLGLGGHSYGGFGTVNAMVQTPFFKAGIAGDGNYNRTLTPNSFQSERRDLWQARETYLSMSPLLYADRLTGALLMYHSIDDQNVGTDPTNSIRLMHALQGLGKTAALYMYPYEDHGPLARETLLDQWARFTAWMDTHVKTAGQAEAEKVATVP